jgi:hypothetical protein
MIDDDGIRVHDGTKYEPRLSVTREFRYDYYLLRICAIATTAFVIILAARTYGYAWTLASYAGCTLISSLFTWRLMRKDRKA